MRQILEPACTSIACTNPTKELVADLERSHRDLEASRHGGDIFAGYRAYWQADEYFHRGIVEATDNEFLFRAYGSIEGHIQRFRLMVPNDMSGDHTVQEHQAIADAFKAGDCAAATAAMNNHIEGIRSRSLSLKNFSGQ